MRTNLDLDITLDDAGKVQWASTFLTATIRSPRNYTRFQLLQKMAEVLDVIGWCPLYKNHFIPKDKFPKSRKRPKPLAKRAA